MLPVVDQPGWMRSARTMPLIESGAQKLRILIPGAVGVSADNAAIKTKKLIESQRIIEGLISPEPKSRETGTVDGYGRKIRNDMERLIDSSSKN